ncbi:MAG: 2-hydroxyacyl-CoA dehydratase family protein [Lachnospiraceae bacterium]|nr:2-hydroxyacyl-CoA dehydratase family protein [Lachnospiraceae bacterium]
MPNPIDSFGRFLMKQLPNHPERFRKILATTYRLLGFQAGHLPSKKHMPAREYLQAATARWMAGMVGDASESAVVNIFMPCEIFHAMDIPAAAPEALATYVVCTSCETPFIEKAGELGAPPSFCSYHKLLMGLAETGIYKKPRLIANTTLACDANQLSFRYLAEKWQVPHVIIDVPYATDEAAVHYVADQLRDMVPVVEEACGKKLDEERLRATIACGVRTQDYYNRYLDKRGSIHLPEAMTPELLSVLANHLFLGKPEAETYCRMLLEDAASALAITTEKKILWMHVLPNWQTSMCEIFQGADNHRVEVVGCDLAYDALVKMDPEKPYESMARRIVESSYNGPGLRRIEKTLEMARRMEADGILIFCQWGCKQTQGIALTAQKIFEENGLPALVLDGDGCDRTNGGGGQIVTRAQAFLEQLEGRR